jgi:hypothetical protein
VTRRRRTAVAAALAAAALAATTAGGAASAPVATTGPTVIGTAGAGKLLTGLSGTWAGFSNIDYRFQWYRCNAAGAACHSVRGAVSPTYMLGDKDVGQTVGLAVRATDTTGTATEYSSLVGPIAPRRPLLESTAQPVVAGPPVQGKTVQVTTGTWSPVPSKLSYRWERCNPNGRTCAAIPNATGISYAIASADVGHALLAVVRASNGSTIQNTFSTATPTVVPPSVRHPTPVEGPEVSGEAIMGGQLVAAPGIWKGVGPTTFVYRWYRCDANGSHCSVAQSSTSNVYTAVAKDTGDTIALTVKVTDAVGSATAYASLVGPVAPADAALTPTTAPTIAGTARVGGALSVESGVWSAQPSRYATTWLRCNANGHGNRCRCRSHAGGGRRGERRRDDTERPDRRDCAHHLTR